MNYKQEVQKSLVEDLQITKQKVIKKNNITLTKTKQKTIEHKKKEKGT